MTENIPQNGGHPQETEINVLDWAIVVLRRKRLVLVLLGLTFLLLNAVWYLKYEEEKRVSREVHLAECMVRTSIDSSSFNSIMGTRQLLGHVLARDGVLPRLFPHQWDAKAQRWLAEPPAPEAAYQKLHGSISARWNGENVYLRLRAEEGEAARTLLTLYVEELGRYMTQRQRNDLERRKAMITDLLKAMGEVKDPNLKREMERSAFVERLVNLRLEEAGLSRQGNLVEVLDPPYVLTETKTVTFFSRRYVQMVAVGMSVGMILVLMLVFFLTYLENLRQRYPEKVQRLKQLLK